jgi:hypothetical protein
VLSPAYLNAAGNGTTGSGAKIYLQLPFCVNECQSNCNLNFCDFHFVAICLKNHCKTTYQNLNDPNCNMGELSDSELRAGVLFALTQLPNTRVTLSRVGICIENVNGVSTAGTNAWTALKTLFNVEGTWKECLELCIEYWVECAPCCTAEETTVPAIVS